MRSIVVILILLLIACSSSKSKYATEEELLQYTGVYYVSFTFFPKDSHLVTMGGIGYSFEIDSLKVDNLENFIENFYQQFFYTPIMSSINYWEINKCLGYLSNESWDDKFRFYEEGYLLGKQIKMYNLRLKSNNYNVGKYNFELKEGNFVNISVYRLRREVDVLYLESYGCVPSSSIELDINDIKSIEKVAILLDKE